MSVWEILNGLGGVALFMFGMKIMSEGVVRAAGKRLRYFLNRMTRDNFRALWAGVAFTSLVQSSSAVSVLTLSFVNAGFFKLKRAFALIVGANIGTTITLWIVSFGYEVNFSKLAPVVLAIATPFFLSQRNNWRGWATFAIGFALIFFGINILRENLGVLVNNINFFQFLKEYEASSFFQSISLIIIGLSVTILVQSSSASTSMVAVVHELGLPLEMCAFLIVGANIGTTSTALLAATVGNNFTKITAYFHLAFNLIGALFFLVMMQPALYLLELIFESKDGFFILAGFHTIFNIVTAILVFPLINQAVRLFISKSVLQKIVSKKNNLHSSLMLTSEMFIYEASQKMISFAGNIKQTTSLLGRLITESDGAKFKEIHHRIIALEKEGDKLERDIRHYFDDVYEQELTGANSKRIHHLLNVAKELENIGDLAIKMSYTHLERRETNSYITPKLRTYLLEMHDATSSATTRLIQNLNETSGVQNIERSRQLEKRINKLHSEAFSALINSVQKEKIKPVSALFYRELIQNYEIIGDHIFKANMILMR